MSQAHAEVSVPIEIPRILCPTDFSSFSRRAFDHALALAAWYEAGLKVLHVLPGSAVQAIEVAYIGGPTFREPGLRDAAANELSGLVGPAARAGIHAEAQMREGETAAEILRAAQELPADLIVMGTHGRTGFERWVLGSVAETVLRRAPCPVLTVPAHAADRPEAMFFKRILCATDFSPASEAALRYAVSLAQEAESNLMVVHVLEGAHRSPEFDCASRTQLRRAVPREVGPWCVPEEILASGQAAPEILRLAREKEAGLIVMGVHGRGLLDLMAFGSVTHDVVREATCPVLTVRPTRRNDQEGRAS
jgi:nucleotide-binding universal stress UspA family protein